MNRERYKTPDEDVAAEFERVCRLFRLALGEPSDRVLFDALMSEAGEKGMNWVEGLQYVVERRAEKDAASPAASRRPLAVVPTSDSGWERNLRRAG